MVLLLAALLGCTRNCDAACIASASLTLADVPPAPYQVELVLGGDSHTWSCPPDDSGDFSYPFDCDAGTFEISEFEGSEVPLEATVVVDGSTHSVAGDCDTSSICGSECRSCAFVLR